jgi:hypothetical protein
MEEAAKMESGESFIMNSISFSLIKDKRRCVFHGHLRIMSFAVLSIGSGKSIPKM